MKLIFLKALIYTTIYSVLSHSQAQTFDYQKQIQVNEAASAYVFDLSQDIYTRVQHSNLSDMRIINANGDFVPMRVIKVGDTVAYEYTQTSLPLFKMNQTINTSISSKQVRTTRSGKSQDYTITTSKTLLQFLKSDEIQQDNVFYIDATSLKGQSLTALEIDWKFANIGNRIFYANLQASNDLSHWVSINSRQKLIDLTIANKHVLENKIPLTSRSYSYYKLSFNGLPYPEITQIRTQLSNHEILKHNSILKVQEFNTDIKNEISWENRGFYTIESLEIEFSQKNLITDVRVYSKPREKDKWRFVTQSNLYSIIYDGEEINNNTIQIQATNQRFWRLVFDENVNNESVSEIQQEFQNHQIQFMAQGQAPFTLLYGSQGLNKYPSSQWYNKIPEDLRRKMFSSRVELKDSAKNTHQLSTAKNKNSLFDKNNRKQWIFWGLLGFILIILIAMASKLLSEVKDK